MQPGGDDTYPTVQRIPPRCPRCRSKNKHTNGQGKGGLVRYHRCLGCGAKYKSVEIERPPAVPAKAQAPMPRRPW
ncbi:MAG: hypothetical protein ABIP94_17090 [Planctomycetota bacterium]